MITEKEYLEAKKIVEDYNEQLRLTEEIRVKLLKSERENRYKRCEESGGHEYRSSGGKWSSSTQMTCIDCGKTIN